MAVAILVVALLFFLGHALSWFFVKTKIPDLLILVIMGYLAGPVFGFVEAADFGKIGAIVATMTLVVILYEGGLHLSARQLASSSLPALNLTLLASGSIIFVGVLVGLGLAFQNWTIALLMGLAISSTSSAIVIPMVKPLSVQDSTKTILSLESAFTDVLAIVLFLVVLEGAISGIFRIQDLIVGVGPNTLLAVAWGAGSGLLWAFFKKRFAPLLKMAFAGEAWALMTYAIIEVVGFNGAIGVLALGFVLANLDLLPQSLKQQLSRTPVTHRELSLLSEVTFILRTFFFLYLGVLIQLNSLNQILLALIINAAIFVTRYLAVKILFHRSKTSRLDAMVTSAMGPRGLAAAVLATLPLQYGLDGGEWLQETVFAIIPISIFLTALFVSLSEYPGFRRKMGQLFGSFAEEPQGPVTPEQPVSGPSRDHPNT